MLSLYGGLGTASSVAEKNNLRGTASSTQRTNTVRLLSSSLILLLSGLPLRLSLLDKGLFKMGEAVMQRSGLNAQMSGFPIC